MGRPSWLELAGIAALGVFGALWGLSLFLFRDPSDPHWAEFAFGVMGVASAVAVSMLIVPLHWWLRHHYRGKPITGEELLYLTSTQPPDMVAFATGVVERAVFTTLALLLLTTGQSEPLMVEGHVAAVASIAGGWIVLKTVMGWRRLTTGDPAIQRLSMVGIVGSLGSVFLGVLAGVLTLRLYFQ